MGTGRYLLEKVNEWLKVRVERRRNGGLEGGSVGREYRLYPARARHNTKE